jgi:Matrixin
MLYRSNRAAPRRGTPPVLCLTTLLTVAGAIALPTDASAYNLEGIRWGGTPTSGCCANLTAQYKTVTESYDYVGLYTGFINWNHSFNSGVNVQITTVSSSPWTVQDTYNSGVTWDGLTPYAQDLNGNFSAASVYINYYYTAFYGAQVIAGVAAHEMGHALGLAHSSTCVLMQPSTVTRSNCGVYGPVQDDKNGVNSLY